MKKYLNIYPFFAILLFLISCNSTNNNRPNFIIIYTDNQGYGDLGCFGSIDIRTPNIDRMAKEGIKFTEFYSASPICSPSRAALLTGRYPVRMGIYFATF